MATQPIIFALANPTPEIAPEQALAARPDAIIATGRTDYPNQVNNVLCFPYIFRGALDCGATTVTDAMEIAAVHAIAELARAEQSDVVAAAYAGANLSFGPEYLIPKPFDHRLMEKIAPAVARAAAESGVATRPIADLDAYREKLKTFVYASGTTMKPIFTLAKRAKHKRVAYAEGEEERVLRAVQVVVDEGLARPTLIGRPAVIAARAQAFGLRLKEGADYDVVNVEHDERYRDFWMTYHRMTERKGVTVQVAKIEMRRRLTLIGAMLLHKGEVDGLLCGTWGTTANHLHYIDQVIGKRQGGSPRTLQDVQVYACMNGLMLPGRQVFLVDTHVNADPSAEELAEITVMAAEEMKRFGIEPRAALLSHSNFGTSDHPSALKMRRALALLREQAPWLEVDGEMHGDIALDAAARQQADAALHAAAAKPTCWCCPTSTPPTSPTTCSRRRPAAASPSGRCCWAPTKPVHVLTASATVRRIVNMTALTVADAEARASGLPARADRELRGRVRATGVAARPGRTLPGPATARGQPPADDAAR